MQVHPAPDDDQLIAIGPVAGGPLASLIDELWFLRRILNDDLLDHYLRWTLGWPGATNPCLAARAGRRPARAWS